ncbi:hypothetical protein GCM10027446_03460 [Angustibacter peucedani]
MTSWSRAWIGCAATVLLVAVAGCGGGSSGGDDVPSAGSQAPPPATTCGTVPTSEGPATALVTVRLDAPSTASAGEEVAVTVTLDVTSDGPRLITVPASSRLLLVRDGAVVGASGPGSGPAGVPVMLSAGASRPAQAVPDRVALVGCPTGDGSAGSPLAPGAYDLVAVLGYGSDPLQGNAGGSGGRAFTLVSAPHRLTVR